MVRNKRDTLVLVSAGITFVIIAVFVAYAQNAEIGFSNKRIIEGSVFIDWNQNGKRESAQASEIKLVGVAKDEYIESIIVNRVNGEPSSFAPESIKNGIDLGTLEARPGPNSSHFHRYMQVIIRLKQGTKVDQAILPVVITSKEGAAIYMKNDEELGIGTGENSAQRLEAVRRVINKNGADEIRIIIANTGIQEKGVELIGVITNDGQRAVTNEDGNFAFLLGYQQEVMTTDNSISSADAEPLVSIVDKPLNNYSPIRIEYGVSNPAMEMTPPEDEEKSIFSFLSFWSN